MASVTHRHLVAALQDELQGRTLEHPVVLDAGCGDGVMLQLIGETVNAKLCGFDSPIYGLQAKTTIGALAPAADIRYTCQDGSWPFEDESVDVVVSNQVVEHVFDFALYCRENARVLRPG